jgi:hypothetical protein
MAAAVTTRSRYPARPHSVTTAVASSTELFKRQCEGAVTWMNHSLDHAPDDIRVLQVIICGVNALADLAKPHEWHVLKC